MEEKLKQFHELKQEIINVIIELQKNTFEKIDAVENLENFKATYKNDFEDLISQIENDEEYIKTMVQETLYLTDFKTFKFIEAEIIGTGNSIIRTIEEVKNEIDEKNYELEMEEYYNDRK